jgi:hypothetical protein
LSAKTPPNNRVHWTLPKRAIAENHSLKMVIVNFVVLASGSASNAKPFYRLLAKGETWNKKS